MGNNDNECGSSLRRSTRKRTLKKDTDFEYDYGYQKIKYQPSTPVTVTTPKHIRKGTNKANKAARKTISIPPSVPEVAAYEIVKANLSDLSDPTDSTPEYNSFESSELDYSLSLFSEERRELMLSNLVKVPASDLTGMGVAEIIDVHYNNLKFRMDFVAQSYLEIWTIPPPAFHPAYKFLGFNPKNYSHTESDELAVRRVVENMIRSVSSNNNSHET